MPRKPLKEVNPLIPGRRVWFIQPKTFHLFHGEIQKIPKDHQSLHLAVVKATNQKINSPDVGPHILEVEISHLRLLTN